MPPLTRWFLKSALAYLVVSLLIGVTLAVQETLGLPSAIATLNPVYFHLFMVGFVAQMIFGVAFWMFPRYSKDEPRGSERLALVTYVALNAGLIARTVAEPMLALQPGAVWAAILILSAAFQWLAALAFAVNTWARVKER
jgi:hypothetical protein